MLNYTSPSEELRAHQALRWYRYLSWALTSVIYVVSIPTYSFYFALGVILTLLLAGHFASNFYQSTSLTRHVAASLVLTEIVGIAILLMPTGGLNSPFIWYALNPIFMAALMLPIWYSWLALLCFLSAATLGSVLLFSIPMAAVWSGKSSLLIVFLMVTASASVFSYLMAGLRKAYRQLTVAHQEAERLLVFEEQNRIANEIHDGVSQHLFSIVYALHGLSRQSGELQDEPVQEQLQLLGKTATNAAQELRASIYRIKPKKHSENMFTATLAAYFEDLEKLNDVKIDLETKGSEDTLSPALKQALTRIVKEATANAIRHGKCKSLYINLDMRPNTLELTIIDDGVGFTPKHVGGKGLGLDNMQSLMAGFGGSLQIESTPGEGTSLVCRIPATGD